jgi:sulfur carrier protein
MQITVNGKFKDVPDGITLESLLNELHLNPRTVVVELNREVVERDTYAEVRLSDGDRLELVRFVGGG